MCFKVILNLKFETLKSLSQHAQNCWILDKNGAGLVYGWDIRYDSTQINSDEPQN